MGPTEQLRAIADALVEGCREGRELDNLDRLYAPDAVSVEAYAMGEEMPREAVGRDAIRAKHEWWSANMEELPDGPSGEEAAEGPFFFGDNRFSVIFRARARDRNSGEVMDMVEVATYHVEGDRIVREEFSYAM